jgi:hypothetical protein
MRASARTSVGMLEPTADRESGAVGRSFGVAHVRRRRVGRSPRGPRSDDPLTRAARAVVTRRRVAHNARRHRPLPRERSTVARDALPFRGTSPAPVADTRATRSVACLSTPRCRGSRRESAAARSAGSCLLKREPLKGTVRLSIAGDLPGNACHPRRRSRSEHPRGSGEHGHVHGACEHRCK